VADAEEIWIPLVDEPIGTIVQDIQDGDPEIARLVDTPHRVLAFKTFAYIRIGVLLGQLLVEADIEPTEGDETWVDQLLADPKHRARVEQEVRKVAEEVGRDPKYGEEETLGPDEGARARFRDFARKRLTGTS
jgi:hypothetical protein